MIPRLSMEPYDGPVTTVVWFNFRSEVKSIDRQTDEGKSYRQTEEGRALNTALAQISREPSWDHTLLATTCPTSQESIAFISKQCPCASLDCR